MSRLNNFDWEAEVTLTRAEVGALGLLAGYVENIEEMKHEFTSGMKDIKWNCVRSAFASFKEIADQDQKMLADLTQILRTQ